MSHLTSYKKRPSHNKTWKKEIKSRFWEKSLAHEKKSTFGKIKLPKKQLITAKPSQNVSRLEVQFLMLNVCSYFPKINRVKLRLKKFSKSAAFSQSHPSNGPWWQSCYSQLGQLRTLKEQRIWHLKVMPRR